METKLKHTPGPWEMPNHAHQSDGNDGPNFSGGDWEVLPPLGESGPVAICSTESNARLVAASPELLEAAWRAIELINRPRNEGVFEARTVLATAIAKAEGRS